MIKNTLTFLLTLFLLISCQLEGIFNGSAVLNGDDATFVKNGYSLPGFGAPEYSGSTAKIGDVEMYQSGNEYVLRMEVVNPGKLDLNYKILINNPEAVSQTIDGSVVYSGTFKEVNNELVMPFILTDAADKNTIHFTMEIESSMRSYDAPSLGTLYVNTRPSPIIPKKDSAGSDITDDTWSPVVENNQAVIYWDYSPVPTDTDIKKIEILYKAGTISGSDILDFDGTTGIKSYAVDNVASVDDIDFSVIVYDDEGLGSRYVSTGAFIPVRAADPVFSREGNVVTITPSGGTVLHYSVDGGDFIESKNAVQYILTTTHSISAYSSQTGVFNSVTTEMNYTANYTVTFSHAGSGTNLPDTYVSADYNTPVTQPEDPAVDGYTFRGWFTDIGYQTARDFTTPITGNSTIYGSWTKNSGVVITFAVNPDYQSFMFNESIKYVAVNDEITLTTSDAGGFSGWNWYVDGVIDSTTSSSSYTLNMNEPGSHIISVIAVYNGVMYSGSVTLVAY